MSQIVGFICLTIHINEIIRLHIRAIHLAYFTTEMTGFYMIETLVIKGAYFTIEMTGFYMIETLVIKGLAL